MMDQINRDNYMARKVLRELIILRKLTELPDNLYTTKILDVIMPYGIIDKSFSDNSTMATKKDVKEEESKRDKKKIDLGINLNNLDHIFIVMDLGETDFKKLMEIEPAISIDEDHLITMLYNQLCAINFLHSTNIIHRDIKPGNMLVDSNCNVKICDFGLARAMPKKQDIEAKIYEC